MCFFQQRSDWCVKIYCNIFFTLLLITYQDCTARGMLSKLIFKIWFDILNATKKNIFLSVDHFLPHSIYILFYEIVIATRAILKKNEKRRQGIYVIKRSIRVVRSVVRHVSLHFANPGEDGENKERQREFGEGHAATCVGPMGRINGTGSIKRHAHVRIMHMREHKTSFTTHNRFLKRFFSISRANTTRDSFLFSYGTRVKIFEYLASCLQRSLEISWEKKTISFHNRSQS